MTQTPKLDQPSTYRIQFIGRPPANGWGDWLSNLTVDVQTGSEDSPAITTLQGTVRDQPALFGLLAHIRDLGLPLLRVEFINQDN
jgi:hypothetical protein